MRKILSAVLSVVLILSYFYSMAVVSSAETVNTETITQPTHYNGEDLVDKSYAEIINIMGGDFDLTRGITTTVLFYNDNVLPGMAFHSNETLQNGETTQTGAITESGTNRIKSAIKNSTGAPEYIKLSDGARLDNNISSDMTYNQLTKYLGDFSCIDSQEGIAYCLEDDNGKIIAWFIFKSDILYNGNYVTNYSVSAEDMKTVNPQLSLIRIYPGYNSSYVYRNTNDNDGNQSNDNDDNHSNDSDYTAKDLLSKSMSEIVKIVDGDYEIGGFIQMFISHRPDRKTQYIYIYNDEKLPGFDIYCPIDFLNDSCFEGNGMLSSATKEKVRETLINETRTPLFIVTSDNAKLDNNISADMHYNDLTKYYGEFNCTIADNMFGYFLTNDNDEIIAEFTFDSAGFVMTTPDDTNAAAMKAKNPELNYIVVYPEYIAANSVDTDSSKYNSESTGKSSPGASAASSNTESSVNKTMSAVSANDPVVKTGVIINIASIISVLIASGIVFIILYKKKKDTNSF